LEGRVGESYLWELVACLYFLAGGARGARVYTSRFFPLRASDPPSLGWIGLGCAWLCLSPAGTRTIAQVTTIHLLSSNRRACFFVVALLNFQRQPSAIWGMTHRPQGREYCYLRTGKELVDPASRCVPYLQELNTATAPFNPIGVFQVCSCLRDSLPLFPFTSIFTDTVCLIIFIVPQ
jgi:hypothetical protein